MKFVTFFFSGTGNTKWTVDQLNNILLERGHEAVSYSIENIPSDINLMELINTADYIGFANPIYGADIPRIMRSFIHGLIEEIQKESIKKPSLYFINTFAYVNGFGIFATRNIFKSMNICGYANIKLFNNISLNSFKTNKLSDKKVTLRKEKAVRRLGNLVSSIEENKRSIDGRSPRLLITKIVRKTLKPKIENSYKKMNIDTKKCNKCMKCVKDCPTKSISYNNGEFIFSKTCTTCMRCYNFCPECAITVGKLGKKDGHRRYKGIENLKSS